MDRFWKAALGVAGIGAVAFFVFYGLYKKWLGLGIFAALSATETFTLMILFLVLTFGSLVAGLIAWIKSRRHATDGDASLHRLEQAWLGVNYINCNSLIGPDVAKAANALEMASIYWREKYIDRRVFLEKYGVSFHELFDQLAGCNKPVPGYTNPIKRCGDFLTPVIRSTYKEIQSQMNR